MVVADANGFGTEVVAFLGARDEHDAVADAEGELLVIVHQGCDGQIGEGKQSASLTDITTVQMVLCHEHLGYGMFSVNFRDPATCVGCKAISTIQ